MHCFGKLAPKKVVGKRYKRYKRRPEDKTKNNARERRPYKRICPLMILHTRQRPKTTHSMSKKLNANANLGFIHIRPPLDFLGKELEVCPSEVLPLSESYRGLAAATLPFDLPSDSAQLGPHGSDPTL